MPVEKPKPVSCPNCQQPAIREGNKITCEICDAVFKITKEGSATVQRLGPIKDHEQRLAKIEATIFADEPEPKPAEQQGGEEDDEPETKSEPENSNADQNDEILPR